MIIGIILILLSILILSSGKRLTSYLFIWLNDDFSALKELDNRKASIESPKLIYVIVCIISLIIGIAGVALTAGAHPDLVLGCLELFISVSLIIFNKRWALWNKAVYIKYYSCPNNIPLMLFQLLSLIAGLVLLIFSMGNLINGFG